MSPSLGSRQPSWALSRVEPFSKVWVGVISMGETGVTEPSQQDLHDLKVTCRVISTSLGREIRYPLTRDCRAAVESEAVQASTSEKEQTRSVALWQILLLHGSQVGQQGFPGSLRLSDRKP